jgi:hypothetical protein
VAAYRQEVVAARGQRLSGAGSASGQRAGPDRGVGPVLDRGRPVGSRTHGGQVEGGR